MPRASKTAAPAALKLKTCTRLVREGSKQIKCGKQYLGDDNNCPNRDVHMTTLKSGYCDSGWCEGTKATDWRGKPAPTCSFYLTCPCECHDQLGKLFEMTGAERILVDSSGYHPDLGGFVMPDPVADVVPSMPDDVSVPAVMQDGPSVPASGLGAPVPTPTPRTFAPTPTGRAARGQLETWVLEQVNIWIVEGYDFPCTPQWISREIGREQAIDPPSVGAINAVFERWQKLDFAVIEKKPTRFTGLTLEGKTKGLDRMKAEAKRKEKMDKLAQRRTLR